MSSPGTVEALLSRAEALVAEMKDDKDRPEVSKLWNELRLAANAVRYQPEEELVERVAIALCIANNQSAGQFKAHDFARAAIEAIGLARCGSIGCHE